MAKTVTPPVSVSTKKITTISLSYAKVHEIIKDWSLRHGGVQTDPGDDVHVQLWQDRETDEVSAEITITKNS